MSTFRFRQGSVLIFSLIVLAIMLSGALAITTSSVLNRQSVGNSAASNQSFQTANSGAEIILQKIYKNKYTTLNELAADFGGGGCSGGSMTNPSVAGGKVTITFFDKNSDIVLCTDLNWRNKVVKIKSEGVALGTTRVIETAVAAVAGYGWVNIDAGDYSNPSSWMSYVNYPTNGSDHTPEKMCQAAGFSTFTGACKTKTTQLSETFTVQGSIVSGLRQDGTSWISCTFWNTDYYFDNGPDSKILCIK